MDESMRGQLLIASPQLADYFRRSVILVIEHTDEGALGVVLNRPTEATVADAVPRLAELAGEDELVRSGGPVQPEAVLALADFEDPADIGTAVLGTVGLLDPDRPDPRLQRLRVFAGYAGWSPGQLDEELEEGAWIVEPARPEDPFASDDQWISVLRRKGGGYALMTTMPDDPTLN
jgi:putative transcriptional regulator